MSSLFIGIEGCIGAGKTFLARHLAALMNARLTLELFDDNPFLRPFYADPLRNAFPLELSFALNRAEQIAKATQEIGSLVSDYCFEKSLVFARINLSGAELDLFEKCNARLLNGVCRPDWLVFLHREPRFLRKQILSRGREYEQNISITYLQEITHGYTRMLKDLKQKVNIIEVNCGEKDMISEQLPKRIMEIIIGKRTSAHTYKQIQL